MWIKYRHEWADGPVTEWKWMEIIARSNETAARHFKNEEVPILEDEYNFSEHYRGVEFEVVDRAPREVVEAKCKRAKEILAHAQLDVTRYEEMLRDG